MTTSSSRPVPQALLEGLRNGKDFFDMHDREKIDGREPEYSILPRFLHATMDEVRLYLAEQLADSFLANNDLSEARHFRRAILRKELGQHIHYDRQRDHAAHTVNNYLLGWYAFEYCDSIRNALKAEFKHRKLLESDFGAAHAFRFVWNYTSLLHDIGYLLEGAVDPLAVAPQIESVRVGVSVIKEFFTTVRWHTIDLDSTHDREVACRAAKLEEICPQIDDSSLTSVADSLARINHIEILSPLIIDSLDIDLSRVLPNPVPSDVFDLWISSYESFGHNGMVDRLKDLRRIFIELTTDGLHPIGVRVVDHGVAGGLIGVHLNTEYFALHFGLKKRGDELEKARKKSGSMSEKEQEESEEVQRVISKFKGFEEWDYRPDRFWKATLWATAATAIHNLVQSKNPVRPGQRVAMLELYEDPLSYLGTLVDILQDWDRYNVQRTAVLTGSVPVQGVDVHLGVDSGKLVLSYPKDAAKKIIKDLNATLVDWESVVELYGN